MSKCFVFVTFALSMQCLICVLRFTDARRAGEGFCYMKINKRTGECKTRLKVKQQKVDCCSSGGAGWSFRKKGRVSCEPCRTSITESSYWSEWGDWSECTATCGPSFQISNRTCISVGGTPCRGISVKKRPCQKPPCAIDGGWSSWGNWSLCSKTCGTGYQLQTRTCTNPVPQYGGKDCQGSLQKSRSCEDAKHCPIHGGWGKWGEWSACSLTCGLGKQTRERKCDSPKPRYGGLPCNEAERVEGRYCRERRCEEIGDEYSGSGSGWSGSGSGFGSGSGESGSGSGDGWQISSRAWSDDEDEDY